MKKVTLLIVSALLIGTLSVSAQRVILRINSDQQVNIDGRFYDHDDVVPSLGSGTHKVSLYKVRQILFSKPRTLVSSSSFDLRNNDIVIEADANNQLRIYEQGGYNSNGQTDDGYYDRDGVYQNDRNDVYQKKNGKGYGPYNNPGKGNKYGLYKNGNGKSKAKKNKDR